MDNIIFEEVFPSFEKSLQKELAEKSEIRNFKAGEQLMRTGQYFRSTMLIIEGLVIGVIRTLNHASLR